ncbi:SusC/RagA family TonB-linked outer membrane protein, partial [Tamlana sp. 2_MG-2023]|nr:SusC/RagA family TonB-linked outer membrane protein [Tamlana sp. 2_MG-2023]MDO6792666.1 SusC/RagA family TonB-linked outer membrane protein [Tamlana sp. 1_MG-2023]
MRNQPEAVLDRWQNVGDEADFQKFTAGNYQTTIAFTNARNYGDNFYQNIYFIRLKNLSLSYKIPVDRTPFSSAKVYFQGQNLLTFTDFKGLDPEGASRSIPPLRILSLGLQCSF